MNVYKFRLVCILANTISSYNFDDGKSFLEYFKKVHNDDYDKIYPFIVECMDDENDLRDYIYRGHGIVNLDKSIYGILQENTTDLPYMCLKCTLEECLDYIDDYHFMKEG